METDSARESKRWTWIVVGIVAVTLGYWFGTHRGSGQGDPRANPATGEMSPNANARPVRDAAAK